MIIMAMTAFELFGVLKLDRSDFDSGLKSAESGLAAAAGLGVKAVGAATAAVTAFGGMAVKTGSTFDQAMGSVAATTGQSVDELNASLGEVDTAYGHFSGTLRDFALYMGQNTTFSATEAANALNYMALAGYNTQQSMEMLPSVLSMAAAGSMDLAQASDMITDTQSALGLSFERTGEMVNEFAKAASSGNTSVEQLGEAMLRVGGLGAELNGGFVTLSDGTQAEVDNVQELEIAFTAMANAGIKGAEAGTHMRNMLLKLSSPTDDGAAAFEALGVSIFDSEGQMRSLGAIMEDLGTGLNSLTQQEKLQAISDIFNTRDTAAAEALMNAMGQDWDRLGESILSAGDAADEMSKTKLDNLSGDMTLFKSALETAQITINDKLSPSLRDFVQLGTSGLQDITNGFNEGGLDGAMSAFGNTLSKGLSMVTTMLPDAVRAGGKLLEALGKGIIDNAPTIFTSLVEISGMLSDYMLEMMQTISDSLDGFDWAGTVQKVMDFLVQSFTGGDAGQLFSVGFDIMTKLLDGMIQSLPAVANGAIEIMKALTEGIKNNFPQMIQTGMMALMKFSGSLRENVGNLVDAGLSMLMALADGLIQSLPVLIQTIPTIVSNIAGIINDNAPKLLVAGVTLIAKLVMGIVQSIPTIIAEFPKIIKMIFDVWSAVNWLSLGTKLITFITKGVKSLSTQVPNALKNIGQKAFEIFKNINWRSLGSTLINFVKNGITGLATAIPNALKTIGTAAFNLFKSIDWLGLGKSIIEGIISGLQSMAGALIDMMIGLAKQAWDSVVGFFSGESSSKTESKGVTPEAANASLNAPLNAKNAALPPLDTSFVDNVSTGSDNFSDRANGNGIIDYDGLAKAIVKAFTDAEIGVEMDSREFGRLVRKAVVY